MEGLKRPTLFPVLRMLPAVKEFFAIAMVLCGLEPGARVWCIWWKEALIHFRGATGYPAMLFPLCLRIVRGISGSQQRRAWIGFAPILWRPSRGAKV